VKVERPEKIKIRNPKTMTANRPLSKNFWLHEMIASQSATRFGFTEQFTPPDDVVRNLEALCKHVLQPLRDAIKSPIAVSSGYRCQRVNALIGGAQRSQHLTGHAADIQDFKHGNEFLFRKIIELKLPFDQIINEFNFDWVHVSYDTKGNRRKITEAYKDQNGITKYRPFTLPR